MLFVRIVRVRAACSSAATCQVCSRRADFETAWRRATTPAEPGLLPGRNEALYWSPWDPSAVSATSCSTSESP